MRENEGKIEGELGSKKGKQKEEQIREGGKGRAAMGEREEGLVKRIMNEGVGRGGEGMWG